MKTKQEQDEKEAEVSRAEMQRDLKRLEKLNGELEAEVKRLMSEIEIRDKRNQAELKTIE
jgi:hypothetical protein